MLTWDILHEYQALVEKGDAEPITCPRGHDVVTRIGLADEIYFQCYDCPSKVYPGLQQSKDIVSVVRSHRIAAKKLLKSKRPDTPQQ